MGSWRGRGSRRRNSPHVPSDLLDDSQGTNYEVQTVNMRSTIMALTGTRMSVGTFSFDHFILWICVQALLEFEELQGAVMAKKTLSKGEIDRLPTKAYDPSHNAGKTE